MSTGCKTQKKLVPPAKQVEDIDLSKIIMLAQRSAPSQNPGVSSESRDLKLHITKDGRYYVILYLSFKGAGINVIESIKKGQILFNRIYIKDESGKELAKDAINFQAFLKEETTITEDVFIESLEGNKASILQTGKPSVKVDWKEKVYTENDTIPHVLFIPRNLLSSNDTQVTIYLELTYIEPFIHELCEEEQANCPKIESMIFNDVRYNIAGKMRESQKLSGSSKQSTDGDSQRFKLSQADQEKYEKMIKNSIDKLNGNFPDKVAGTNTKAYFRRWKLVTDPRNYILRVPDELKARIRGEQDKRKR
jgi:hypothetical protein